jgi:LacI family transcriptional regulator
MSVNYAYIIKSIESLYLRGTDGIIIAPTTTDCGYLKTILPPDFPLVFVDRQPTSFPANCVLLNNLGTSYYEATRYLLNKGYTRIGFVSFHFGEAEIEIKGDLIKVIPDGSSIPAELLHAEPYTIMKELLVSPVQAVLCGNSLAAIGVYRCLKDSSIPIPGKVPLITFDDDLWLSMPPGYPPWYSPQNPSVPPQLNSF